MTKIIPTNQPDDLEPIINIRKMNSKMNTILEDINQDLNNVERKWIRRPVTLTLLPFLFLTIFIINIIGSIIISLDFAIFFLKKCW